MDFPLNQKLIAIAEILLGHFEFEHCLVHVQPNPVIICQQWKSNL